MIDQMNYYGKNLVPFLFIIDFEMKRPIILPLNDLGSMNILYSIRGVENWPGHYPEALNKTVVLKKYPLPFEQYRKKFDFAVGHMRKGDSYLLNLTYPTRIEINLSFKDIFFRSTAKYKLLYNDELLVFSPEIFVTIHDGVISSYPMKGTIDAALPDAKNRILNDEKEFSEHLTIVDLIRNDLNMVSTDVTVEQFRYIEKIRTTGKELFQVSSKINGILSRDYHENIGTIMATLLPAGSVTGAPKNMTLKIIKSAEQYDRGYYTGIFGYFDGKNLDSGVMIRYMEKINDTVYYKSGGGITVYSDPELEYKELLDKVYVPIN
jgi:para-aminobenzoate synthetase component I